MVQLREIPRTAVFAWSPGSGKPLLVTGTRAGAVDADFSDETKLEVWDLVLDSLEQEPELQPLCSISADSKFYDIAWGPPDSEHPHGIIAGALENGSLELWDAEKLIAGSADASIGQSTKHSGAIKTLQFNPLKPQILATGGAKGELFIYNIEDIQNPFRLGNAAASRADDIECLAWNKKVSHILATGGAGGLITVWDVKTKKASLTLNNNRKSISSISWDPSNSTKLLTASPDDNNPVIYLWNLRNSNAPEKTLTGHEQGVLSLSWCQQDPEILLSCGKDNRTLVWNPHTGENYGELQEGTNWSFRTSFNPENPDLTATASFDGKITVQTLQNTNNAVDSQAAAQNLDAEDFFASAHPVPQVSSFSLPNPPSWFLKPVGATFGFGGKVVYFTLNEETKTSTVHITQFSADADVAATTETFEAALKANDVRAICQSHIDAAKTDDEKADWEVLGTLVDANPRQQVIQRLGFKEDKTDVDGEAPADKTEKKDEDVPDEKEVDKEPKTEKDTKESKDTDASSFFGDGAEDEAEDDDFLSGFSKKPSGPFHLFGQGNTKLEDTVTKAVMLGNFAQAVDICLAENRIADAFVMANCGSKDLVQKVQTAYLAQANGAPSYLRLLSSVAKSDLTDLVENVDLANWKEILAALCTFAKPDEFPSLCEALGDRISESGSRKDASFCYLVGSKLEKVVHIWISELQEAEKANIDENAEESSFSLHAKSLQQFIEKVTVFRHVTAFQDGEASLESDWKLAPLYDRYLEYADIVADTGLMAVAQKYLDLVPAGYPEAEAARNRVKLALQKGVLQQRTGTRDGAASRTKTTSGRPGIGNTGYPIPQPSQPVTTAAGNAYGPPATAAVSAAAVSSNPYAPASTVPSSNPYGAPAPAPAPVSAPGLAAPAPAPVSYNQGYLPPQQTSAYAPPTAPGYGVPAYGAPPPTFGAPPKSTTPSAAPPPPRKKDVGTWNDVPMVTRAPVRRSTPSVAPVTTPFGTQQNLSGPPPPPMSPYGAGPRASPTPPPPPKGPAPPRVSSPLVAPPPAASSIPPRPASSVANTYAPPPPAVANSPPSLSRAPIRTQSPYNPPPAAAPPSNRYAPAQLPQQAIATGPPTGPPAVGPPPRAASGSYTPVPQHQSSAGNSHYAPSPYEAPQNVAAQLPLAPPPSAGPPRTAGGPPPARPGTAGTDSSTPSQQPQFSAPPRKPKYPSGDRSHIPPHAQKLVEILNSDLQRVAAKAPPAFAAQVKDTGKRLNILFDHLNNAELVKDDTIQQLHELAEALEAKAYDVAQRLQVEIHRDRPEECGNWMVGVKRLIAMSKATP